MGAIVNFSTTVTGTAPLGYQWWFNGTNRLANATNASLSLTNVQLSHDGAYTLVATNAASAATSQVAYLTLLVPPAIVTQPTNQTTTLCSNVAFYVTATGGGPLRFQWWFNETKSENFSMVKQLKRRTTWSREHLIEEFQKSVIL